MKAIKTQRLVKIELTRINFEDGSQFYQADVDPLGATEGRGLSYGMECGVSDLPREIGVLMERIIKDFKGWI